MVIYEFKRLNFLTILVKYIIIFLIVILSRDSLFSILRIGFHNSFFLNLLMFLGILIILISKEGLSMFLIQAKHRKIYFLLPLMIIFLSALKFDFQLYHISIISYILSTFLMSFIFSFRDFYSKLSNVMVFLSIYSLITVYILRPVLFISNNISQSINIVYNSLGLPFFDLGLSYVVAFPHFLRNFGIFREPGIFQFFLMIPFIFELFISESKFRKLKLLILFITVISTFSTAGILMAFFFLAVKLLQTIIERKLSRKHVFLLIFSVSISIIVFTLIYANSIEFRHQIFEVFSKLIVANESSAARLDSITVNFRYFLINPIIGNRFSQIVYSVSNNTSTTMSIFAIYGFLIGFFHLYLHFKFTSWITNIMIVRLLVFIGVVLLINNQFLLGNSIYWIFSFSFFFLSDTTYSHETNTIMPPEVKLRKVDF